MVRTAEQDRERKRRQLAENRYHVLGAGVVALCSVLGFLTTNLVHSSLFRRR